MGKKPVCKNCQKELKWGRFAYNQDMCWDCFSNEVQYMLNRIDGELHKDILKHLLAVVEELYTRMKVI